MNKPKISIQQRIPGVQPVTPGPRARGNRIGQSREGTRLLSEVSSLHNTIKNKKSPNKIKWELFKVNRENSKKKLFINLDEIRPNLYYANSEGLDDYLLNYKLSNLSVTDQNEQKEKIKIINFDIPDINIYGDGISSLNFPMEDSYNYCYCGFHKRINYIRDEINNHDGKIILLTNNYINVATAVIIGYSLKKNESNNFISSCSMIRHEYRYGYVFKEYQEKFDTAERYMQFLKLKFNTLDLLNNFLFFDFLYRRFPSLDPPETEM